MKNVCFVTMRPNRGATGGPGGVLYMLQQTLGDTIKGVRCRYLFQSIVKRSFKGRRDKINQRLFQLYFLLHPHTYYITHDIYTAKLLAKMHRKYSLVYHQQGPIVQEKLNFGEQLSEDQIQYMHEIERMAFENAVSVHFPSKGAEDMYFDNEYASCKRKNVHIGQPLYNTIPTEQLQKITGLKAEKDKLTFFSLGTLTSAKGQDQVIGALEHLVAITTNKIRYIIVGSGPMSEQITKRCNELAKKNKHFEFIYYPQMTHAEVMYIHSIADIYIMLHRISIFDFATLEAMVNRCAVVLSFVGGNIDFNKDENILFVNKPKDIEVLLKADIETLKSRNKAVFDQYFSPAAFKREYTELITNFFTKEK